MPGPRILVVDDEKNIRLTLTYALEEDGYEVQTASSGTAALEMLMAEPFDLLLLDLKMAGLDGLEVIRRLRADRNKIRIVIITAHGTVENAVEAMKLGAVDFIQKPFTPAEIRRLVREILAREKLELKSPRSYELGIQLARRLASDQKLTAAIGVIKETIGLDPSRPEAFNLLGGLHEIAGQRSEAMKNYRVALDLDPTYRPARENLQREWDSRSHPDLG